MLILLEIYILKLIATIFLLQMKLTLQYNSWIELICPGIEPGP